MKTLVGWCVGVLLMFVGGASWAVMDTGPYGACRFLQLRGSYPADKATGIPLDARLAVQLSGSYECPFPGEPVSVTLTKKDTMEGLTGQLRLINGTNAAYITFQPDKPLEALTSYKITVYFFSEAKEIEFETGEAKAKEPTPQVSVKIDEAMFKYKEDKGQPTGCSIKYSVAYDGLPEGAIVLVSPHEDFLDLPEPSAAFVGAAQEEPKGSSTTGTISRGLKCDLQEYCLYYRVQLANGTRTEIKQVCQTPAAIKEPGSGPGVEFADEPGGKGGVDAGGSGNQVPGDRGQISIRAGCQGGEVPPLSFFLLTLVLCALLYSRRASTADKSEPS